MFDGLMLLNVAETTQTNKEIYSTENIFLIIYYGWTVVEKAQILCIAYI